MFVNHARLHDSCKYLLDHYWFPTYWFEAAHSSIAEMSPIDNADDDSNNDNHSSYHNCWENNQQYLVCVFV